MIRQINFILAVEISSYFELCSVYLLLNVTYRTTRNISDTILYHPLSFESEPNRIYRLCVGLEILTLPKTLKKYPPVVDSTQTDSPSNPCLQFRLPVNIKNVLSPKSKRQQLHPRELFFLY